MLHSKINYMNLSGLYFAIFVWYPFYIQLKHTNEYTVRINLV